MLRRIVSRVQDDRLQARCISFFTNFKPVFNIKWYPSPVDIRHEVKKRLDPGLQTYCAVEFPRGSLILCCDNGDEVDLFEMGVLEKESHITLAYDMNFAGYHTYHARNFKMERMLHTLLLIDRPIWGQARFSTTGISLTIGRGSEMWALLHELSPDPVKFNDYHILLPPGFYEYEYTHPQS